MVLDYILTHYWLVFILINLGHISDYFCTLKASKFYQSGVDKFIDYEGGIELNPTHRKEINALKKVNLKFIALLVLINLLIYSLYLSAQLNEGFFKTLFEAIFGMSILTESFIHIRHFRAIDNFRLILRGGAVSGQIKYGRTFMHRVVAGDALIFCVFYLILFILIGRYFFLGGAFTCFILFRIQKKWLKKIQKELMS